LKKTYERLIEKKNKAVESALEWQTYQNDIEQNKKIEENNKKIKSEIKSLIILKDLKEPDNKKLNDVIAKKNEIKKIIELPEDTCPVCLQKINLAHKDKIDKVNDQNIKEAQKIEEEIEKERKNYEKNQKAYLNNEQNKQKLSLLKTQIMPLKKIKIPDKKIILDVKLEEQVKEKLTVLEIRKNNSKEAKGREQRRLAGIASLKKSNTILVKSIQELTLLIKTFSPAGIRSKEMRIKLKPIIDLFNKYIPNSDIKTLQILKNELSYKEVFQVFSKGKEYSKMSLGEKTKIDICISKIIDHIAGNKIKTYFIDNAEIMDALPNLRKQSFVAKVNKLQLKIKTIK